MIARQNKDKNMTKSIDKEKYLCGRPILYDIEGILGRADFEIARLKKIEKAKDKSLFRYEEYDSRAREVTSGYEDNYWLSPEITGTMQEWIKAYKRFCNKKVNIYGKKVDRTKLLNDKFATNKFSKKCQD